MKGWLIPHILLLVGRWAMPYGASSAIPGCSGTTLPLASPSCWRDSWSGPSGGAAATLGNLSLHLIPGLYGWEAERGATIAVSWTDCQPFSRLKAAASS